jgi:hypothetical protein
METHASTSCELLANRQLRPACEPFATPSNNIGLGLQVNETVRILMRNKSHRGDPCRHLCSVATAQELSEPSVDEFDKPGFLLPIVDMQMEIDPEDDWESCEPLPSRRDGLLQRATLALTVCGDSPVRAPEAAAMIIKRIHLLPEPAEPVSDEDDARNIAIREERISLVQQARALLFSSVVRASELLDTSRSVLAGEVNSCIASAKRIIDPDLNVCLFSDVYCVYKVDHCNIPRSFSTTPWNGVDASGFDLGTSGGMGIRASALTADKRCAITHCHALFFKNPS